jgi:hypothetical protein
MATPGSPAAPASQLDVIVDGTWVIVPSVDASGNITGVEVYSPSCGHPHGAIFVNALNPNPWPAPASFYMLDDHSHTLNIQRGSSGPTAMPVSGIDTTVNHCLVKARPIGGNWDLMLSITSGPDAWVSSDTVLPQVTDSYGNTVPCFSGKDVPTAKVSSMQTLSYKGVTGVSLCGAPAAVQALFPAPWSGSGSLIIEGEVPYIPTLQHERAAIFAMANLAGLDLSLDHPLPPRVPAPAPGPPRPMDHTGQYCGHALIVLP